MGVDVGVGVESVGGPDGGECDGVVLASEDGPEVPYMPREVWCAGEGVGVGTDVEGHADGVEDEGHVQPGVGGAAVGWEGGVVAGDVVRHKGGESAALWGGAGGGELGRWSSAAGGRGG